MKRKHKTYTKPKRPFDKKRIEEEKEIIKKYGLKNKREIWKTEAKIKSIREKTKKLIKASPEEQQELFKQLKKIGLKVNSIGDALALKKEDYLERRLQTIVFKKGLANTIKQARQLIVHKKILVDGKVVDKPSYIVPIKLENKITKMQKIEKVPEHEKLPEEEKLPIKEISKEVPEEERFETAEEKKLTEKEVKEAQAEAEGK